jgi:hypothetical protein
MKIVLTKAEVHQIVQEHFNLRKEIGFDLVDAELWSDSNSDESSEQRKKRLYQWYEAEKLNGGNYAERVAKREGITTARLRQILKVKKSQLVQKGENK